MQSWRLGAGGGRSHLKRSDRRSAVRSPWGPARRLARWLVFAGAGIAGLPLAVSAGAWTQPKGQTYLRTTVGVYTASQYFDGQGDLFEGDWWDAGASVRNTRLRQVVEYGYEEDLTLIFDGEFKSFSADRTGTVNDVGDDRVVGLGDAGLGVRYRFRTRPVITSVQARLEVPGGYERDRVDYALGSGDTNGEVLLQFGGILRAQRSNYWTVDLGYRFRGGPMDDDLVYAGAFGLQLKNKLWGRVGASGVSNTGDAVMDVQGEAEADPRQGSSYLGYGAALAYVLNPTLSIEMGTGGELAGKNTFRGTGFDLTLEIRY